MRAVRVAEVGGPEAMQVEDIPEPEPGEGQARVRLTAAGVNFIDVYFRSGQYPMQTPFTLGQEGAGVVDAVGPGVSEVAEGDRVAYTGVAGSYAEAAVVPVDSLVPVPESIELQTAAAVMLQGMTAHYLTTTTYPLASGHKALVHAGAGGVGLLLTQMAKRLAATVYTTVSTEEKAQLSRQAGADEVIRYTEQDFVEEVRRLAPGGMDVVYDSVGKDTFDGSLRSLGPRGMMVLYGQSSGAVEPVDPQRLAAGGALFLTRPSLKHYVTSREWLLWRASDVFDWIEAGQLEVRIGETHPLDDAALAHRRLEGRQTTGKVLLLP